MNFCVAATKFLKEGAKVQQQRLEALRARRNSEEDEADASIPTDVNAATVANGKGHVAVHSVIKLASPQCEQNQTRRGDVYFKIVEAAGKRPPQWKRQTGSRENAQLYNAGVTTRLLTDPGTALVPAVVQRTCRRILSSPYQFASISST